MPLAIRVHELSKRFQIGGPPRGLRETLASLVTSALGRVAGARDQPAEIWALKDVSFDVAEGEVVGVIGRNGAGKSTLLKILTRITRPTAGHAEIRGRVGSLLEVGTGFHPELTGRDNIFLNAAILGMSRLEVQRKFDEIVDFAGVQQFVDTQVKHYSSGMYMRLAFAVAANLRCDVMLVDEVLAVGDLEFQRKCLGAMDDLSRTGRTILFVSHNINAVRRLCRTSLWIDGGRLRMRGETADVLRAYEHASSTEAPDDRTSHVRGWRLESPDAAVSGATVLRSVLEPVVLRFSLHLPTRCTRPKLNLALYTEEGERAWGGEAFLAEFDPGPLEIVASLPCLPLRSGLYRWRLRLSSGADVVTDWQGAPYLEVTAPIMSHSSLDGAGFVNLPFDVRVEGQSAG